MRRGLCLLALVAACSAEPAPTGHDYPEGARDVFAASCPTGDPRCDCMWDSIVETMSHEEYEVAMARFTSEGLMDPRMTAARLECRQAK